MTSSKKDRESIFKYTRPFALKEIEERLLEIDAEKSARSYGAAKNIIQAIKDGDDIKYLDVEKTRLQLKRQFILDRRNSWKAKSIWDVVVPIIVSIITAYVISVLVKQK